MVVLDTNILVRFAVNDDAANCPGSACHCAQTMWINATVLLELEWVLRSRYSYEPGTFTRFFRNCPKQQM